MSMHHDPHDNFPQLAQHEISAQPYNREYANAQQFLDMVHELVRDQVDLDELFDLCRGDAEGGTLIMSGLESYLEHCTLLNDATLKYLGISHARGQRNIAEALECTGAAIVDLKNEVLQVIADIKTQGNLDIYARAQENLNERVGDVYERSKAFETAVETQEFQAQSSWFSSLAVPAAIVGGLGVAALLLAHRQSRR